jgi:hypothetical protein
MGKVFIRINYYLSAGLVQGCGQRGPSKEEKKQARMEKIRERLH